MSQVRLTNTRDELVKEQGRLRRQLAKLGRSLTSSLHSVSESSSTSTSFSSSLSLDSALLETGVSLLSSFLDSLMS